MTERIPYWLEPTKYERIARRMLGIEVAGSNATVTDTTEDMYPERSFAAQMQALLSLDRPLDTVLVTAKSAIPVADAVRGFYDATQQKRPFISYIRSDSTISRALSREAALQRIDDESKRLQGFVKPTDNVCIIDQAVESGLTLEFAKQIIRSIGVRQINLVKGDWYVQAPPRDIQLEGVTSNHAEVMREIGHKAANLALE